MLERLTLEKNRVVAKQKEDEKNLELKEIIKQLEANGASNTIEAVSNFVNEL
jgi:hypothetical protein